MKTALKAIHVTVQRRRVVPVPTFVKYITAIHRRYPRAVSAATCTSICTSGVRSSRCARVGEWREEDTERRVGEKIKDKIERDKNGGVRGVSRRERDLANVDAHTVWLVKVFQRSTKIHGWDKIMETSRRSFSFLSFFFFFFFLMQKYGLWRVFIWALFL